MKWIGPLSPALRRAFDVGVHQAARVGYKLNPQARPESHDVEVTRNIAYRRTGRRAHRLDVYRPSGDGPTAAILYVHGGAFSMLSKDTHRVMALVLATQGYTVFNINYSLGPTHTYPAPLEDVCAALEWVYDHAEEHGADASRIAVMGESAGANLVTALTFVATHPRPEAFAQQLFQRQISLRAALPIYGLLDVIDTDRLFRDRNERLPRWMKKEIKWAATSYVGWPVEEKAPEAPLASPLLRLAEAAPDGARELPPFFATAGTADPLLDDSRRLRAVLEARGVPCELHVYPGEIHGFNAMLWRPNARRKWRAVFRFLALHLGETPQRRRRSRLPDEVSSS